MKSPGDSSSALRDLVSLLTAHELEALRTKLRKGHKGQPQQGCKTGSLLEALLKMPEASNAMLGTAIYGHPDDNALKYLRLRLFSKILESLELSGPTAHGEAAEQQVWQQLCCAQELWQRGGYQVLESVLPGIVRKAAAMEHHPAWQAAMEQYRRLIQLRGEDCAGIDAQLSQCAEAHTMLRAAASCLADHPLDFPKPLKAVEVPWSMWLASPSVKVRFHGLCLRLQAMQQMGQSDEALQLSRQLLLLVRNHSAVATPDYHAQAQCHLAHAAMQVGLPKMALEAVTSIAKQGTPCTRLQWQADLLAAEAMRLAGKHSEALQAYQQLLLASANDPSPSRLAARRHLAAGTALQAGQPLVALMLVDGQARLLNAHPDWEMANRLLQIMAMIDAGQAEQAELRLDALRKSMPKLTEFPRLWTRYAAIVKLLQRWMHHGFDRPRELAMEPVNPGADGPVAGYPFAERVVFEHWWLPKYSSGGLPGPSPRLAAGGLRQHGT